jgi:hypothetical protein
MSSPVPAPTTMDIEGVISISIATFALVVSGVGTFLSNRRAKESERLANEALNDARAARTDALWSNYLESVHDVMAVDPADPGNAWKRMRVTGTALVDGLPDWDGLDLWLTAEHALGLTLGRQALTRLQPGADADARFEPMKPSIDWAMILLSNARLFRAKGPDQAQMESLTDHARETVRKIHERHGWELPEPPSSQPL